jgi:hypothetical protein
VVAFLALGLFPRRIDAIILIWLGITYANELTIDAPIFEKLFMADDSGFFAVGLLIYEYYRGRRDLKLYGIFALSVGTSVFQAIHKLEHLGVHTGGSFDARVVAAICLVSIAVIFLATRIRKLPLPAGLALAAASPIRFICCTCRWAIRSSPRRRRSATSNCGPPRSSPEQSSWHG